MSDFDGLLKQATKWNTAAWMETGGMIADDSGNIKRPVCNEFQREVSDIIMWCHENQRPARIIILKPRRKGSSTVSVAAGYRRLQAQRATGCIAGGSHYQGGKLFDMMKIYAENDSIDPKTCKVQDMVARFKNGSSMDRLTLANAAAGRSGGYQFLVITEMALLSAEGVANAPAVVSGLLKTVKFLPETIVILESTASGATGDYYERYQAAITFEEFKAGRNGFVKVFYPWYSFEDSRTDPAGEGIRSERDLTDVEKELADRHGLGLDQVAWMRMTLRDDCRGDFDKFQEDYPFDENSAFLKSGRCLFDEAGLAYQAKLVDERERKTGILQHNEQANVVTFIQTDEAQARMQRWEEPRVGCRYLVAVDSASGEEQTSGEDPDSHGVFVLRHGYLDHRGCWIEPAVVMANMLVPGYKAGSMVCWWANDILTEEVWKAARYYQALVVPEENHDRGLIELLRQRGDVSIFRRPIFNRREQTETNALGWQTTVKTRPMMLETLAAAVREAGRGGVGLGIEVRCPWALKEMRNFGTKPSGRMEALVGHDDRVLTLAIGMQCIGHATPYIERMRDRWIPPDLRKSEVRRGRVRGGMS